MRVRSTPEELRLVIGIKFFTTRKADEIIELLEAFQVILQLHDDLVVIRFGHKF
jgi:hypothetical protein